MNTRFLRNGIVMLVLVVGTAALLYTVFMPPTTTTDIPYSGGSDSFLGLVKTGQVDQVIEQGTQLTITLKDPTGSQRTSQIPGTLGDGLMSDIRAGKVSESFGSGTAAVITPVGKLCYKDESLQLTGGKVGKITQQLYDTLTGIQTGKLDDRFGWVSFVE